jgi:hypothetical protein
MIKNWKKHFAIDYRSVALFRMGTALCLFWDTTARLLDAKDFLTESGVFPLWAYNLFHEKRVGFSIYAWSSNDHWPVFLLLLTLGLGVMLFIGSYPRIAAIALWLLNISIHQRNPFVQFGGDTLLQTCLFWLMFTPSRPEKEGEETFSNGLSIALFLQIAIIYISAGWQKNGADWQDGSASFYAVSIGMYGTATGEWLRQWPLLLKFSTFFVLYLERCGSLLFFLPWKNAWSRASAFFLLGCMHLTFAVCLQLYFFAYLDMALLCLLIPSEVWQSLNWRPKIRVSSFAEPKWIPAIAVFLIFWLGLLNLQSVKLVNLPWPVNAVSAVFRLEQAWALFAPSPFHFSNWVVIEAESQRKKEVVKLHGFGASSFFRPASVVDSYASIDWLRYYPILLRTQETPSAIRAFGRFVCRVMNEEEKRNAEKFNIYIVRDYNKQGPSDGSAKPIVDRVLSGDCRKKDFSAFAMNYY